MATGKGGGIRSAKGHVVYLQIGFYGVSTGLLDPQRALCRNRVLAGGFGETQFHTKGIGRGDCLLAINLKIGFAGANAEFVVWLVGIAPTISYPHRLLGE